MKPIPQTTKPDHAFICGLVERGSHVLDLGCGRGELLSLLVREKSVTAQGIELQEDAIYSCVEKGLSVFHGDIESGLGEFPDVTFDYVILNQSLQEIRNVDFVLQEALRVGRRVIVGFPNIAFIRARMFVFFGGRAPISKALPYQWYDTPNVHWLSVSDFRDYCARGQMKILNSGFFGFGGLARFWPNLLAETAVFLLGR